jgi:2-polyprenyl-3-methyl-5-hydroxy-6-metoxy-1,4-benzoquinol methylase
MSEEKRQSYSEKEDRLVFNSHKADNYDSWYNTKKGNIVDEIETKTAFELFQPSTKEKILDVGCGTGNFSIKLAGKGCRVTGVDVAEPMLEKARLKASARGFDILFYRQDIIDLKFEDDFFDGVISMAAVEFVPDIKRAYQEMKRVVKPGGKILIGTINRDSTWGELYREQSRSETSVFHHAILRIPEELEKIDRPNLVATQECLFIPPDAPEDEISWEEEKRFAGRVRGGFFCILWKIKQ